jgi:hypothetical protein
MIVPDVDIVHVRERGILLKYLLVWLSFAVYFSLQTAI